MNPLACKLEAFSRLGDAERGLLDELVSDPHTVPARTDLIREGEDPGHAHLIVEGWACRYKLTPAGKRTIVAYLVPGDFCDLHVALLGALDHSIGTLGPARVVQMPRIYIDRMLEIPGLAKALWCASLIDEAISREWLVNLSARDAPMSLAHLLAEMFVRLRAVRLVQEGNTFEFPLTQEEIGDSIGLSTVHVNRTLQALRAEGLLSFERKHVTIPDPQRLFAYSGFNPNYLHLPNRIEHRASGGPE